MGEMAAAVRLQRMLTVLVLRFVGGCVGVWVGEYTASDVHVRLFSFCPQRLSIGRRRRKSPLEHHRIPLQPGEPAPRQQFDRGPRCPRPQVSELPGDYYG
jgi:hypothetical protein